ncbi:MAG TPA: hypothetical protein VJK52_04360, partial [Candidatus Nanoarchaeia archaeon]|nr:hypothetical protein [Candidatus Nanoarchaeia archaeon]
TLEDIQHVLKLAKVQQPKRITLYSAEPWKHELVKTVAKAAEKTRNVSAVLKEVMAKSSMKRYGQDITRVVPRLIQNGKITIPVLGADEEFHSLQDASSFLFQEFGAEILIERAENSTAPKAKQAMPGKVAILVE